MDVNSTAYLHKDLLVLCHCVELLARRAVVRQPVVQLHAECHVLDWRIPRRWHNPGKCFGALLFLSVRAVELERERDKANTNVSMDSGVGFALPSSLSGPVCVCVCEC